MAPAPNYVRHLTAVSLLSLYFLAYIHSTLGQLSPTPSALWTGINPTTVTYNPTTTLLYIVTSTSILATNPADLTTLLANTTLPTSDHSDAPVACGRYLHLTASDDAGHAWLWTWDATTLAVVRSYEMPYQLAVMACAAGGEVLLTGRASEAMVVAMRASDGKRLAAWQLSGMHLRGCAVSEADGLLYALDDSYDNYSVQVFNLSYTNPVHLRTLPLANITAVWTIAIDPTSTHLYLQAALQQSDASALLQLRPSDGRLRTLTLASAQYEPNDGLAVLAAERVLLGDHLSFTLLAVDFEQPSNVTRRMVGPRPLLQSVTALAVDGQSCLYVASKWPANVVQLDGVEGRLVATYDLNDGAACADRRQVAVAVDAKRQVYASLCDGRIGVYNQQQQLVDHVLPFNYSAATTSVIALFVSRNSSQLYYTDMAYPTAIFRYDLAQRKVAQTWSNASATYECFAVDERDASIYACNNNPNNPTLDHYASNGTLLSSTQLLSGIATITSLALSYTANQLIVSLFYADSDVLAIDLTTGNVGPSYSWSDGSVAGCVAVDERTGRVYAMDGDASGVLLFDGAGGSSSGVGVGWEGSGRGRGRGRHNSNRRRARTEVSR